MLRLLGYRVTAAASSVRALGLFQESPGDFDLLITDMTMPELTGERLTAEVRARRPELPVIICTGYNRRLSDKDPKTMAVQAILMKPVEHIEFARTVRAVLDGEDPGRGGIGGACLPLRGKRLARRVAVELLLLIKHPVFRNFQNGGPA